MAHMIDSEPELRDVFKKLLPCACRWRSIGILLGMKDHMLENIRRQEYEMVDRLRSMLTEWLKLVDHPPTWKDIIDAVRPLDTSTAKQIEETLAH